MVRYMADSVDSKQIPASIAVPGAGVQPISLRGGYAASSRYHSSSFASGTPDVVVDVSGAYPASDVLDIEKGDATPDQAPAWVKAHNALNTGYPAVLYCNRATLTAVANACAAAGLLPGRDFRWWIATLDGTKAVADMSGVTAVQVWGANFFPGHNIDLSIVYDDAWKAPAPVTAVVQGEIAVKYNQTPGLAALLGAPTTPETVCPDKRGRYNHFAGGSIYWTAEFGAYSVRGAIRDLWAKLGWEAGTLGYPQSDELEVQGWDRTGKPYTFRVSFFEHGAITWTSDQGAYAHVR